MDNIQQDRQTINKYWSIVSWTTGNHNQI